mgnify:CR=1 FL=1
MIKIEIETADTKTKSGVSARTGKPYSMREQRGYAYTVDQNGKPNKYPSTLTLTLRDEQAAYQPGLYTLAPGSLYTNKFDQLEISPVLIPIVAASASSLPSSLKPQAA